MLYFTLLSLRVSCVLSIIGSAIVMAVCNYTRSGEKQKGRQLIFWLSFADFGSSLVYFLSSFETNNAETSPLCQTYALLGIFFPVASFLWTDFIAYYLYTMIVSRQTKVEAEWKVVMTVFHVLSWGISAICITLVGAFGHAGRQGSDGANNNTGGWCWVRASDKTLIFWELIGGKFVEWTSCFIILPYLYFVTAKTLINLDRSWTRFLGGSPQQPERETMWQTLTRRSSSVRNALVNLIKHENELGVPLATVSNQNENTTVSNTPSPTISSNAVGSTVPTPQLSADSSSTNSRNVEMNKPKFKKFYSKMALVPVLFCFVRIWGSIRVVIYATTSNDSPAAEAADGWLHTMQAIFDPSQGFANALLFVFLSSKNMNHLWRVVESSPFYVSVRSSQCVVAVCGKYTPPVGSPAAKGSVDICGSQQLTSSHFGDGFASESYYSEDEYMSEGKILERGEHPTPSYDDWLEDA